MLKGAATLIALLAIQIGAAQNAASTLTPSPMWIDREERYVKFFSEIESPLLIDIAHLSLYGYQSADPVPIPATWLGEFALANRRDISAEGTGLVCHRVQPPTPFANVPRARLFLTWLQNATDEQKEGLLKGTPLSSFDANGSHLNRIVMNAHPLGMGGVATSASEFTAQVSIEVNMKSTNVQGSCFQTFQLPLTLQQNRDLPIKPIPAVVPLDATHQVADFKDGKVLTIYEVATQLYTDFGIAFQLDPKLWDAPIFLKGKWDVNDLAEGLCRITDSDRGTYQREDPSADKLREAYDSFLEYACRELGVPEIVYNAGRDGSALPFEVLLALFPKSFERLRTDTGYSIPDTSMFQIELRLAYILAAPGTLKVEAGDRSTNMANVANLRILPP